jgi:hypothetical protein
VTEGKDAAILVLRENSVLANCRVMDLTFVLNIMEISMTTMASYT